jgi:hypothetical protein
MDGREPRRDAGIARNQSRRDGIRAGAVSGPWRSEPRADPAPPALEGATREAAVPKPAAATIGPQPSAGPPLAPPTRERSGRGGSALRTVLITGLAAVLLAGGALWLERQGINETTGQVADIPTASGLPGAGGLDNLSDADRKAAAQAWADREAAGGAIVPLLTLRIGSDMPPERIEALRAALVAARLPDPAIAETADAPESTRVSYFHEADQALAYHIAAILGGSVNTPSGSASETVPGAVAPPRGTIDIWIGR